MPTLDSDYAKTHEELRQSLLNSYLNKQNGVQPSQAVIAEQKRLNDNLDKLFEMAHQRSAAKKFVVPLSPPSPLPLSPPLPAVQSKRMEM